MQMFGNSPHYDAVLQAAQAGDRKRVDQRVKAVLAGQNPHLREFWKYPA